MDSLPSLDSAPQFFKASNMFEHPLEKWLQQTSDSADQALPSCIVADFCLPWTANIAHKFNIPRVIFHGISCFTLVCSKMITRSKVLDGVMSDSEPFLVPDMPDRIEFIKAQIPEVARKSKEETSGTKDELKGLIDQFKKAEISAQGILVNTFQELEPKYVEEYQKMVKKVWCIGPGFMSKQAISPPSSGGNNMDEKDCHLFEWLAPMKPRSVVYACFGSLCKMSASQMKELALGLEASNRPFIWVIKKGDYSAALEAWFEEAKFQERVKGRGLVIRGWAPQVLILSHPATGGFLTHCGWNSTLEGVSAGLPMITWPMFAEQFYNDKLIVQVLRTGAGVGAKECVSMGVVSADHHDEQEDIDRVKVKSKDIKKAIDEVMDEGEEGEERRRRAWKLGEVAKKAVQEGGSSYLNMTLFIQHVTHEQVLMNQDLSKSTHVSGFIKKVLMNQEVVSAAAENIVSREARDSMQLDRPSALDVVST